MIGMGRTVPFCWDVDVWIERDRVPAVLPEFVERYVGEIAQFEGGYRMCYLRGPAGIIVGLAQQLS